ncbi:beta-propeller domain-containing protein [Sulfurimonas aquatica]|nr:beta-propeller domain-containing protein [Sulfurimonas aquatica]
MRLLTLLTMLFYLLQASETLRIQKGWQLIGVPTTLDVEQLLNNENVDIVWGFDANTQSWMGYSPEVQKNTQIVASYKQLTSLKPYQAMLILSKENWSLEYEPEQNLQSPKNSSIELLTGWNLVALPQKSIISDKLFGDALVWKFSQGSDWQTNKNDLNFPSIESITLGEGLWVKSESNVNIDINTKSSELSTFNSEESMLSYIRKMVRMNEYYSYSFALLETTDTAVLNNVATPSTSDETAKDTTSTNLQESGVDEGDILKHDGVHIFSVDNSNHKIIITSFTNIARQIYTPINSIDYTDKYITSMYLQNSRLVVVSNANNYNYYSYSIAMPSQYSSSFNIDIYDISDINSISLTATHNVEGYYVDSRLIDNNFYLISSFSPFLVYSYNKIDEYRYDYENPTITSEKLTPKITSNGVTSELINPLKFYAPIKLNQRANITSISSFNIDSGVYNNTSSFLGNSTTQYVSTSSIYLVSNEYPLYYDFTNYKEQQMIYHFSLDENLSYKSRGLVEGRMLNQFSMSEKDEYLRVATTSGWAWWGGGETTNSIYTLKDVDKELQMQATLTGLGKEGETIRAVRFMGDRGYVVTFRQTDPLYTIDLSDPTNPQTVGELSIPGFSSYLHVVDENRVLSIGRNADESGIAQELQFQLFDVSDFTNPKLADKIQIGDRYSYSEAEHNHKAFTYRASDLMFGVPYRNYSSSYSEHFGIYQIDGMSIKAITAIDSDNSNWGDVGRGLLFDLDSSSYGALFKGSNIISKNLGVTK